MRIVGACLAALLLTATAAAQSGLTGNWSGAYTYSVQVSGCSNQTFTSNGNVTVTLLQTGGSLSGRMDLTDIQLFSGNCNPTKSEITRALVGTIRGSSVAWNFPNDKNGTQFSGTVDGDTITAQISGVGSGSLTMKRAPVDPQAANLTGTWSGNYNFTDRCSNGGSQVYSGAFTLGLTQSQGNAGGVVTMQTVPLYDQNCRKIASLNVALVVAGVVSGSTLTGAVFDPSGSLEFPISASIGNHSLSGTVAGANGTSTTGTFNLTLGSSTAPASDFTGNFEGSYAESDNETLKCINIRILNFDGPASITLVQAGRAVSGWLTLQNAEDVSSDGFGDCVVADIGDEVLPLYGSISNNTLTLLLPLGGGIEDLFTLSFSGNTIMGTISDTFGDVASFTTTKTANAAPPGPRRRAVQP